MVTVKQLSKVFQSAEGPVYAVQEASFQVPRGEFYTLLGPSGCGKTTTLRCIAGLEEPNGGEIYINDRLVASSSTFIPPEDRGLGMVFQSYAIWPHLTVFENVAFPLKRGKRRFSRSEIRERVMDSLSLVKMGELAHRPAPFLSGGQQQRVALARALAPRPEVLLLDEPLSNLDAKLREEMRLEIKELVQRVGITTLYVTHDQLEALAMSDRIAVLWGGRMLQEAKPKDLYLSPNSKFVAQFIGQVNFFKGCITDAPGDGRGVVESPFGQIRCVLSGDVTKGTNVLVALRPENLRASGAPGSSEENSLEGKVEKAIFLGDFIDCQVAIGEQTFRAKLHPREDVAEGKSVFLVFDPESCVVLAEESVPG